MPSLSGWLGFATRILPNGMPEECCGYVRAPFFAAGSPTVEGHVSWLDGPREPWGSLITHGVLYDALESGRPLLVWKWLPPLTEIPERFKPLDFTIAFVGPVLHALNASAADEFEHFFIEKRQDIGGFNGQLIQAGTRLLVAGGTLMSSAKVKVAPAKAAV